MPELPEVERVRRSLSPRLIGQTIQHVHLFRPDIVEGPRDVTALLRNDRVARIDRLGKQLAIISDTGRVVAIHLGMTGSLRFHPSPFKGGRVGVPSASPRLRGDENTTTPRPPSRREGPPHDPHVHLEWRLSDGSSLRFRDPRRFGGVWTFPTEQALLDRRWRLLGPDALAIRPAALHQALSRTRRPLKAALLDQNLVAGLGNIYVDELLHTCRWSPLRPADTLDPTEVRRMVQRMRALLNRAIDAGGSTLRDYVDSDGAVGGFQLRHQVYGRGGQPCRRCGITLTELAISGRTTVYCDNCQSQAQASS